MDYHPDWFFWATRFYLFLKLRPYGGIKMCIIIIIIIIIIILIFRFRCRALD